MNIRLMAIVLLLLGLVGQALADLEREPRHLRLYMTDMHGWGEIRDMSLLAGDTLFVSLIVEDAAGNPVVGARLSARSQLGNRVSTEEGFSDKDGWIHADILATTEGEDTIRFRVGELHTDLKLVVAANEEELPPTIGQAGQGQTLVVDYPGALPWETLADATPGEGFGPPTFGDKISPYDGQEVILQGFMLPLQNEDRQSHFILSANPPHCYFCMPGGAESLVEIHAAPPIRFSYDPIVLKGKLRLIRGDESMGLYYQINGAKQLQ